MTEPSSIRQAAVLLAALPKPQLAAILKRLAPAEAAAISTALSHLNDVHSGEQSAVIECFLQRLATSSRSEHPVPACATTDATSLNRPAAQTVEPSPPVKPPNHSDFEALFNELSLERCLELLSGEEPPLLAAVLFLISAKRCAEIVERMELTLRTQVLRELAGIAEVPPSTEEYLRRRLQRKLEFGASLHARPEGIHRIRQILEHLDPPLQGAIADSLTASDPKLAAELHRNVFRFNDLVRLARSDVKVLLRHVDTGWWAPALRHADPRVRQHVFGAMAAAAVKILTGELEALQELPVDLSTLRQQQIVEVAQELFRTRVISRPTSLERAAKAA